MMAMMRKVVMMMAVAISTARVMRVCLLPIPTWTTVRVTGEAARRRTMPEDHESSPGAWMDTSVSTSSGYGINPSTPA